MGFWKRLFRGSNQAKQQQEPVASGDKTQRLVCPLCGEVYLIGKDATITTMGNVLGFLAGGGTPIVGSASGFARIMQTPALVGHYVETWSAEELEEKKAETIENMNMIRQALQSGQQPQWQCFKCLQKDHPNSFPRSW